MKKERQQPFCRKQARRFDKTRLSRGSVSIAHRVARGLCNAECGYLRARTPRHAGSRLPILSGETHRTSQRAQATLAWSRVLPLQQVRGRVGSVPGWDSGASAASALVRCQMFEDLNLVELRELLRQLESRQAETERLIREVADRIRESAVAHEREETRYPVQRRPIYSQHASGQSLTGTACGALQAPHRAF